jgi:hypothetical protein
MGQLNSGIATKSCSYDFSQHGALGSGVVAFSGISFKPGEAMLDIRVTRELNLTSGSGSGTLFQLGWGPVLPNPYIFATMFSDTLNNINGYAWNLWQSPSTNQAFKGTFNWRFPATNSTDLLVYFTSNAALTAGKVDFLITYALTKF